MTRCWRSVTESPFPQGQATTLGLPPPPPPEGVQRSGPCTSCGTYRQIFPVCLWCRLQRRMTLTQLCGPTSAYLRLPGRCESALAPAAFSDFVLLGFESTFPAAEAALLPVTRPVFFATRGSHLFALLGRTPYEEAHWRSSNPRVARLSCAFSTPPSRCSGRALSFKRARVLAVHRSSHAVPTDPGRDVELAAPPREARCGRAVDIQHGFVRRSPATYRIRRIDLWTRLKTKAVDN